MDGLQQVMRIAPLLGIGAIMVGTLWLVNRWKNTKDTIRTTRETIEWLEDDPITNSKVKHSKVIVTQERI